MDFPEPCLCGDPECPQCFPQYYYEEDDYYDEDYYIDFDDDEWSN